jgi:hypothetical protein
MVGSARGLRWEILDPELLMVSYYDGPGEHDRWAELAAQLRELRSKPHARFLVCQGEQPPLTEVQRLINAVRGGRWRVAMVSPSVSMRFVASSFSLVVKNVRFFAPEQLDAAFDHLACTPAEKLRVNATMERLRSG